MEVEKLTSPDVAFLWCAMMSQARPPWQLSMMLGQASPVAHLGTRHPEPTTRGHVLVPSGYYCDLL